MFIGKPKHILSAKEDLKRFPASIYFTLIEYLVLWFLVYLVDLFFRAKEIQCLLCDWRGRTFYPAILNQKIIKNRVCPKCASQPKDRSFIYAVGKLAIVKPGIRILDVCPSRSNVDYFGPRKQINYTAIDLYPDYPGIQKMDIRDLKFPSQHFDCVFCLNVLEHVKEDLRALNELRRVVRFGGQVFIEVPLQEGKTVEYEKPDVLDHDHVRHYGLDVTERFKRAGFKYKKINWSDLYTDKDKEEYGLKEDTVFVLTK